MTHRLAFDDDFPLIRPFKTSNHPEGGGLPAAGRTEHRKKFAVADLHGDMIHSRKVRTFRCDKLFYYIAEFDGKLSRQQ